MLRVFFSCDSADEDVARIVSRLVEKVFPEAEVVVIDHLSSALERLESIDRLKTATVVVPLITPRSLDNRWLIFEAGMGMAAGTAIPLLEDGVTPLALPEPLEILRFRQLTEEGLTGLMEDIAKAGEIDLPQVVGVHEALYRLEARFTPLEPNRRDGTPTTTVQTRVKRMIERTHKALVTLVINSMSPGSVPAPQDLENMRLHQLRDLADYAHASYPSFLLYTLSSLQLSHIEGDDASWSLFNDQSQLDRLERLLGRLERDARASEPEDTQ